MLITFLRKVISYVFADEQIFILILFPKGAQMHDPQTHEQHISTILGQMVKKWCAVLPVGVRKLEKFNRENNNVLLKTGAEKEGILAFIKLKQFKGIASGQRIDLSAYKKALEPISYVASDQEAAGSNKDGV